MNDRVTLLKNIELLGRIYCTRYLDWDRDKLESDWFTALSFFFGNSFMRGRRDEMSNEYFRTSFDPKVGPQHSQFSTARVCPELPG
jgi:hypothetical protein